MRLRMQFLLSLTSFISVSTISGQPQPVPQISNGGVVDAASYSSELSPGSIMSIYGTNLASATLAAPSMPLPSSLSGTTVEVIDGTRTLTAPLFYVSAGVVSAQLPFELTTGSPQVRVRTSAGVSAPTSLKILPVAPKLFTKTQNGLGEPLVYHNDYTLVSATAPARAGEAVFMYLIGLGAVSPAVASGARAGDGASLGPLNMVPAGLKVSIGGTDATVLWAGLMPGFVGVYQVNFQFPSNVIAGSYAIQVSVGSQKSQAQVAVAAGDQPLTLFDNFNTAACNLIDGSAFNLTEDEYITSMQTWYQWKTGETSVGYTLSLNGQTVNAGTLSRSSCDANQGAWCLATTDLGTTLSQGAYTLGVAKPQVCANPGSNGAGFVRLYGVPAGGGWLTQQSATISQSGGQLSAPGATIQFAAGALSAATAVSISTLRSAPAPSGGIVSKFYRLDGLPSQANAPITVTFDAAAVIPDGEVFLVMQPAGDGNGGPTFFPATVSGGKIVATLPAIAQSPAQQLQRMQPQFSAVASPSPHAYVADNAKLSWLMWMMGGLQPNGSSKKHFIIHIDKAYYQTLVPQLDQALEYAWSQIDSLGLKWVRRGTKPIEVYVFSYSSWSSVIFGGKGDAEGNEETEFWAKDNIGLCLNLDMISKADATSIERARITSGHELLHVIQSEYDPRTYFVTLRSSPWLWLDEMTAVWFERVLSSDPNYISDVASTNLDYLLKSGMEYTTTWGGLGIGQTDVQRHGYGESSFLQYLAPASPGKGDTRIGDVLKLMAVPSTIGITVGSKYSATEALGMTFNLPGQWVSYCAKWLEGTIYPSGGWPNQYQVSGGPGYFGTATDFSGSSMTLSYSGTDLSAQLYRVNFPSSLKWATGTKMTFTLSGPAGGTTAIIYKVQGKNFTPYQTFASTFSEANAEQFISSGTSLVILLVNSHFARPYTSSNTISLTMSVAAAANYPKFFTSMLNVSCLETNVLKSTGTKTFNTDCSMDVANSANALSFTIQGGSMPITWNGPNFSSGGTFIPTQYSGTDVVSFDGQLGADGVLSNFHAHQEIHYTSPNGVKWDGTKDIKLKPFPRTGPSDTGGLVFDVKDTHSLVISAIYDLLYTAANGDTMHWVYDPATAPNQNSFRAEFDK